MLKPFVIGVGFNVVPKQKRGDWLKKNLEKSGPTYIKIGQFIANRSDIFGKDLSVSLKSLQDEVQPLSWDSVKGYIPDVLESVDANPLATASIAQVHRAKFKGKDVVVKIKKPGIDQQLKDDVNGLRMLMKMFPFIDVKFLDEFEKTLSKELDFKRELKNIQEFSNIYRDTDIIVPRPYPNISNEHVIVMDYVPSDASVIRSETLINLFIDQLLFENVIHGDLHSGNIGTQGDKIVLYDFGNVIRTSKDYRRYTRDFVYFVQTKNVTKTIETMRNMGMVVKNLRMTEIFIEKFFKYLETLDLNSFKFDADEIQDKVPVELGPVTVSILRSFSLLEGYCKSVDPHFSYNDILFRNLEILYLDLDYVLERARKDLSLLL